MAVPARVRSVLLATPWIAILAIIAVVQAIRGQAIDTVVFAAAAVLVLADAVGLLARLRLPPSVRRLREPIVLGLAAVAGVVLLLAPRHGAAAGTTLVLIGVLVLPVAWLGPGAGAGADGATPRGAAGATGRGDGAETAPAGVGLAGVPGAGTGPGTAWTARMRRAAIAWSSVVVAACLLELGSFLIGRAAPEEVRQSHPAVSELLDPALETTGGRAAFLVVWLALGVLLVLSGMPRRRAAASAGASESESARRGRP